jgi:hypothetical protein
MLSEQAILKRPRGRLICVGLLALLSVPAICAQQASDAPAADKETLALLLKRIDQLEARVSQLEAEKKQAGTAIAASPGAAESATALKSAAAALSKESSSAPSTTAGQAPSPTPPEPELAQSDSGMSDRMDLSKTLLRIRGFGDISLHGDSMKGDTTSFSLGQLDLFVTSDVSEKFKFLSEIVFEAGPNNFYGQVSGSENSFGVDIERYLLQYSHNDYFNISAGRVHTAIGYYNTAYHHSTWLQTTTGRPFLFDFEDHGGILPIHTVGASASGLVPSGRLGLHYVAEIGNGRASRTTLTEEPVQNEIDDENHKAYNLALFVRPEAVPGLQAGFSIYRDILSPAGLPRIEETILAGHAVLIRPRYEWLNEAVLDRHTPFGSSKSFNTPGFYTQISRQFGMYRPYFRYEYINAANNEPVFPDVALRHGPSLGLRFDASESVALKLQYDHTFLRDQPGIDGLTLQLGFTF